MTHVSTHVLDAVSGTPAVGVAVTLTDADGHAASPPPPPTTTDAIAHLGDRPAAGRVPPALRHRRLLRRQGVAGVLPRDRHRLRDHRRRGAITTFRVLLSPYRLFHLPRELSRCRRSSWASNQYGKAENRVVRIYRDTPRHEIHDINVSTCLRGDFSAAHLAGDQSEVLPTDTQKQTAYAYAKEKGLRRSRTTVWRWPGTSSTTSSR